MRKRRCDDNDGVDSNWVAMVWWEREGVVMVVMVLVIQAGYGDDGNNIDRMY